MKGYKIANHYIGSRPASGPVLVVLEIPDDAKTTTPEKRYEDEEKFIKYMLRNSLSYCIHDNQRTIYLWGKNKVSSLYETLVAEFDSMTKVAGFNDETGLHRSRPSFSGGEVNVFVHVCKCRADKAKVVDIIDIATNEHYEDAKSIYCDVATTYIVGKTVFPDAYNLDLYDICSNGIHYFEDPRLAIMYMLLFFNDVTSTQISREFAKEYLEGVELEEDE